jgi:hypothetical protein
MSTKDYPKAVADFRDALLKDDDVQTKFRAAFPKIASWLLDGDELSELDGDELSEDELADVDGGVISTDPISRVDGQLGGI